MKIKKISISDGKTSIFDLKARNRKRKNISLLQTLLLDVTRITTSPGDLDTKVQNILNLIGNYTNLSRVCIFEDNHYGTIAQNKYEWCNKNVDLKSEWPDVRYEKVPSWKLLLDTNGCIVSENISSLPDDVYEELSFQCIKSILVLPIRIRETTSGCVVFRECKIHREWPRDEIDLLETVCNVLANVFELDRTNSELLESEKRYRQTFRLNPSIMLVTTFKDGVIVEVNDLFMESVGLNYKQVVGLKTTEINLITQSTRDEITGRLERDKCIRNFEFKYRFEDQEYYGLYNASLMEMNGEKHIISSFQNITLIKETENELNMLRRNLEVLVQVRTSQLEKSQKYFQALIEAQNDLICRCLPDTTFTYVNQAFAQFYGMKAEELIGSKWLNLLDSKEHPAFKLYFEQLVRCGKALSCEKNTCNADGQLHCFRWIDTPILDQDGKVVEIQSNGHDITDRIDIEKKLIQAKDAAEQSDRLKTAFLQTVSHELRTPLNSIMGFSELIDEDETIDTIMEYRDYILNGSETLLHIIDDILEVSRMEAGHLTLHVDQIDILNELNIIKNKFANSKKYCDKDIELRLQFPEEIKELWGYTDVHCLRQIFDKLLENAYQYTPKGSIGLGIMQKEADLVFYVKDTGIGISSEFHNIIFENFRQVDDSASRKYGGLGIGLSLTKKIIEAMDGKLWVESEIGKGACFYFTLPLTKA